MSSPSSSSSSLAASAAPVVGGPPPARSNFLTPEQLHSFSSSLQTPYYCYSAPVLQQSARAALSFPSAYGITVRYAMKACPTLAVLQLFHAEGIKIDASSVFEVERAIRAGYKYEDISLSTQELGPEFVELVRKGVKLNACSLSQLSRYGEAFPNHPTMKVGIRINPGVGSGGFSSSTTGFSKTNVGGPASSFGIWNGSVSDGTVNSIIKQYGISVDRIHTHIGSGSDPAIWESVASLSLTYAAAFPTVTTLNLGGGYKVARYPGEKSTDLQLIGGRVKSAFEDFAAKTGRQIKLEIEPGTFLVANSGALVTKVQDVVSTSEYSFLKLDAGMTDVLRPSLYGAMHPLTILPADGKTSSVGTESADVVVVGHCCESGDLMTPLPGQPESLGTRHMRKASIGDYCVIDGCGAYCSGMSTKNYNSFPESAEVMLMGDGTHKVIRRRQKLEQMWENEVGL